MKLVIPLTGTVLVETPFIIGDDKDPVRPVDLDLGHVSWVMVNIDLENEVMEIEVTPMEATEEEKIGFLQYAQNLIMGHTKDELYEMSKCHRLKRPFKGVK